MTIRLQDSQFKILSRYCEDISKAVLLYNVAGYFFPSVLSSSFQPSVFQLIAGSFTALTFLIFALILSKEPKKPI